MLYVIHQNVFVLEDADHQNLVFMQNKSDIRNQHKKLHLIANFLFKKILLQISIVPLPPPFSP